MLRIPISGDLPDGETMNYYFKSLTEALVKCFTTEKRAALPSSLKKGQRSDMRWFFSFFGRQNGKRR